jgi:hypothetical protein
MSLDAFPEDAAPRWLQRDRDSIYRDALRRRVAAHEHRGSRRQSHESVLDDILANDSRANRDLRFLHQPQNPSHGAGASDAHHGRCWTNA